MSGDGKKTQHAVLTGNFVRGFVIHLVDDAEHAAKVIAHLGSEAWHYICQDAPEIPPAPAPEPELPVAQPRVVEPTPDPAPAAEPTTEETSSEQQHSETPAEDTGGAGSTPEISTTSTSAA